MPENDPPTPPDLLTRLKNSAFLRGNQSSLYQWYARNYETFAAIVDGTRPGWDAIADELNREKLTKRDGTAITGEYARKLWWKVKAAHDRARSPSASPKSTPPPPPPEPTEDNPNPYNFKTASVKKWT